MNCPHCGECLGEAKIFIPERDKPEIKHTDVVKMYEQMPPIKPQEMNTETHTYVPLGVFDCVDGT